MEDSIVRVFIQFDVPVGKTAEVKGLLSELIERCKKEEPTLLSYEFFFNDEGTELYALEWYKDSAAIPAHMGMGAETLQKLLETAKAKRIEVLGDLSDEVREQLSAFKPVVCKFWGGFRRIPNSR